MVSAPTKDRRLRFAEFASPPLPRIVEVVVGYLLLGSVITFLVGLLPMLILEEGSIELGRAWKQMDALGRYGAGIVFLVAVLMVIPALASNFLATTSIRRAIEAQAENQPEVVAEPGQLRRDPEDSRKNLRLALWIFCGVGLVIGGLLLVFGLVSLADDVPDSMQGVLVGLGGVAFGVACLLGAMAVARPTPARSPRKTWSGDVMRVSKDIQRTAKAQEQLPVSRAVKGWRAAVAMLSIAEYGLITLTAVLVAFGVAIRQPCRTCEPRTFGPGIEATLDQYWMVMGGLAAASAVVLVVHGVIKVLAVSLTRRQLLARINQGQTDLTRPDDKVLHDMVADFGGPWGSAAHLLGLWMMPPILLGSVWLLVGTVGHTIYAEFAEIGWTSLTAGLVLFVLHVVCVAVEEVTDPAIRDRIRDAWPVDERKPTRRHG